jgi:putative transposase
MPYLTVWIHYVWCTKYRQPLIKRNVKIPLYAHIRQNAVAKGIHLDVMNGTADHVHAVIRLNAEQSIAKVAQMIKGESSHWLNQQQLIPGYFEWQDEYYAASVSESALGTLRSYIANQEKHHSAKTFAEDWQTLMEKPSHGTNR